MTPTESAAIIDRLSRHDRLRDVPRAGLEWIAAHGELRSGEFAGVVTAACVHLMLDRAHALTESELHGEKMFSLGKLAAGLAHELNNPASAARRATACQRVGRRPESGVGVPSRQRARRRADV